MILLLVAAIAGIALQLNIIATGPTSLAGIGIRWAGIFVLLLALASVWWALYLWLLYRLGGLSPSAGLRRSAGLMVVLSLSILPDLAVFLAGRLPFTFVFDGYLRSIYIWIVGSLLFLVFVGQELALAAVVQRRSLPGLAVMALRRVSALPRWIAGRPKALLSEFRRHPSVVVLVAILVAGIYQRWQVVNVWQPGDMNDLLSVTFTNLTWPPFRYYHDYRPQTYIYAHLPLFPMLMAPFYWFFENVAKLPTAWAAKLLSALGDMGATVVVYRSAGARWKGSWGLIMAALWMLSPVVVSNDDRPVCFAAAFAIAAMANLERDWLCGGLLALGMATRTEVVFLALPIAVHFLVKRELREKVLFFGALLTTLGVIALPFVLYDPAAIDFAMRLQGQRQASGQASVLLMFLQTHAVGGLAIVLERNPSFFPMALILAASLLALRDGRVSRVALVAGLAYILGIPVLHDHYMVFFYAAGVFYAARYGNPLVAIAMIVATGPGIVLDSIVQLALAVWLALCGLLQLDLPETADVAESPG